MERMIIIGGGISGLTAAVYAARADLKPLVIEGKTPGGQLMLTTEVENFPGFPEGIQGPKLIESVKKQAERFGARFQYDDVDSFKVLDDGTFEVAVGEKTLQSKVVIVATGASARMLGLESETKYIGRGVSTCATCDAYFFKEKLVAVIGGGDSACEEALVLTKFAKKVYVIHRRDELRASKIMAQRILGHEKIEMIWDSTVDEVVGDDKGVTGLKVRNLKTDARSDLIVDGMFLGIGHIPNTKVFKGILDLDDSGYLKADEHMKTNVKGVFAAGDVYDHYFQQAITAAASGCKAVLEAEKYLEGME